MNSRRAVVALSAPTQETRLEVFRLASRVGGAAGEGGASDWPSSRPVSCKANQHDTFEMLLSSAPPMRNSIW